MSDVINHVSIIISIISETRRKLLILLIVLRFY